MVRYDLTLICPKLMKFGFHVSGFDFLTWNGE